MPAEKQYPPVSDIVKTCYLSGSCDSFSVVNLHLLLRLYRISGVCVIGKFYSCIFLVLQKLCLHEKAAMHGSLLKLHEIIHESVR